MKASKDVGTGEPAPGSCSSVTESRPQSRHRAFAGTRRARRRRSHRGPQPVTCHRSCLCMPEPAPGSLDTPGPPGQQCLCTLLNRLAGSSSAEATRLRSGPAGPEITVIFHVVPDSPAEMISPAGGPASSADAGLRFTRDVMRPVCPCWWPDIGTQCCIRVGEKRHLPHPYGAVRIGAGQQRAVRAERHAGYAAPGVSPEGAPAARRVARFHVCVVSCARVPR